MKDMVRNLPLRLKVMMVLTVFVVITVTAVILSQYYFKERERIKYAYEKAQKIDALAFKALFYQDEFLLKESINPAFFQSDSSHLVRQFTRAMGGLNGSINELKNISFFDANPEALRILDSLDLVAKDLSSGFSEIVEVLKQRGFKDFGTEGIMRDQAHLLEDAFEHVLKPERLLSLRRHEKDFINRREEKYVGRFEAEYRMIRRDLFDANDRDSREAAIILDKYFFLFKELVMLERMIGLNQQNGLKVMMENTSHKFSSLVDRILVISKRESSGMLRTYEMYFIISLLVFILAVLGLGIFLARSLTRRLIFISDSMNRFVQSNFTKPTLFSNHIGNDEIGRLARNFQVLQDEIGVHFKNYRTKVEKRTMELLKQKSIVEKSKLTIEQRNQDILDSIKYAKRIQDSVLPSRGDMNRLLPNYFVFYKPKDIVSGDFYWVDYRDGNLIVAVADCTGHGVPGAFMSILGHNFLNQAVNEHGLTDPGLILGFLNMGVTTSLVKNRTGDMLRDGMDISIISLNVETGLMKFSGAQRPIFVSRKDELIEMKGTRIPIGGFIDSNVQYEEEIIKLNAGDRVYLFSDGYADQFGGEQGKKFKYYAFRQMIFELREKDSLYEQRRILETNFEKWKGDHDQVDDVCILGFEYVPQFGATSFSEKESTTQIPELLRKDKRQYLGV